MGWVTLQWWQRCHFGSTLSQALLTLLFLSSSCMTTQSASDRHHNTTRLFVLKKKKKTCWWGSVDCSQWILRLVVTFCPCGKLMDSATFWICRRMHTLECYFSAGWDLVFTVLFSLCCIVDNWQLDNRQRLNGVSVSAIICFWLCWTQTLWGAQITLFFFNISNKAHTTAIKRNTICSLLHLNCVSFHSFMPFMHFKPAVTRSWPCRSTSMSGSSSSLT